MGRAGKGFARKYSTRDARLLTDGKLLTDGAAALFVMLAGLAVQLGDLVGAMSLSRRPSRFARMRYFEERAKYAVGDELEESFHTPPSSPPPFDLMSPSDGSGELSRGGDQGESGVTAPTLSERLRNAATAMNVMRRIGVAGILYTDKSDSTAPRSQRADLRLGINRSMRAYNLFEEIKKDYQVTFERFPPMTEESPERDAELQRVHERCAKKCLELARTNGGLYTKAAQFVASLQGGAGDKGIPKAYVDVLRVLTDAAPYHEFREMNQVLVEQFGVGAEDLFASFDEVPIAAASLAQVHRAVMKNGMPVAVKILYPSLRKEMASDFAMFRRLGGQIKPGGYDMLWLVEDFETAIRSELDCEHEARNCEIAARLLAGRRGVKFPQVVWDLTRNDVLVMEFVPGLMRLTEPEVLVANGLELSQCGQLVSDALTELALVHGHVHGDPHGGNIYIIGERTGRLQRSVCPCVVVLDHGLYHHIDDVLRRDLCALFLACINRNRGEISRLAHKTAGPLGRFFPLLLSPWFILGTSLSSADVRAAKENKLPPSVSAKDVGDAMTSLHVMGGNVLGVLHSFGYVRGLLNAVSFGERRRLKSIARMAVMGLVPPHVAHRALLQGDSALPLSWRWKLWKARTDVDITAALLHLLTTAMAEEFDVSKTPAPFLHLAAAILRVGRWPSMHMLHHKFYAMLSYFYGEQSTPAHMPPRDDSDGEESSQGDNVVCKKQAQEPVDSTNGAVEAGSSASGERVGAVGLIQKVKSGVLQRTGYLRSCPPPPRVSDVGSHAEAGDEVVRHGGRATSLESLGPEGAVSPSTAPSLMGESVISRADSEQHYYTQGALGGGAAAAGYSGSYASLQDLSAAQTSISPRDRCSASVNGSACEKTQGELERPATEPVNVLPDSRKAQGRWAVGSVVTSVTQSGRQLLSSTMQRVRNATLEEDSQPSVRRRRQRRIDSPRGNQSASRPWI